ncbi:MAG: hypothetical protein AB2L24_31780 [Mangrovibacterium sp.]
MNTQMKHGFWTIMVLSLIVSSCHSVDYSSLTGKELRIPGKIKNNRLELHANGSRTIYWIGEDFDRSGQHMQELINKIPKASPDLQSDVFVLVNRKLEKEFKSVQVQFPVAVYYVDENMLDFQKKVQKRKRVFPSSRIVTNSDYVIQTILPLDFFSGKSQ